MSEPLPVVLADSIVDAATVPGEKVIVSGSHGGISAAVFTLRSVVRGVLFNDAGVGKEQAGIEGLRLLENFGIYAAAVDAFSAEIGNAEETRNGRISHANKSARSIGVFPGISAMDAVQAMAVAPNLYHCAIERPQLLLETSVVCVSDSGHRIVTVDSNSLIGDGWEKDIVFTGSHGGRVGLKPAVPYPVLAVFYNDAGIGKNCAGITRLEWLESRGVAAGTVSAASARIGFGLDTYSCGIISHVNAPAADWGISPGIRAVEAAQIILERAAMH